MNISNKNIYFNNISQFQLLGHKKLGEGTFGQVVQALHLPTNKLYAIKIVHMPQAKTDSQNLSWSGRQLLDREMQLNRMIDHPHIVKVWQILDGGGKMYIVMDFVERGTLFCWQNLRGVFPEGEASGIFAQVVSAVEYLHAIGLMHRDLKPENILLDKDLNVKICDFGWAVENSSQLNTTFCGTYEYMAPEMLFENAYDQRIDIWALGVLLYELLHGHAPFQGAKAEEVRKSMEQGQIHIDSNLSLNAQDLILSILRVDPDERLTIEEIREHPWLVENRKKRVSRKEISPKHSSLKKLISILDEKSREHKGITKCKSPGTKIQMPKKENNLRRQKKFSSNFNLSHILSAQSLKRPPSMSSKNKKSSKNILKGSKQKAKYEPSHKYQKSSISELYKYSRLKTEVPDNRTMKFQHNRIQTQIGELGEGIDQRSTIKKRNTRTKKLLQPSPTQLKKASHRRSID